MSQLDRLVSRLFRLPGHSQAGARGPFRARAAGEQILSGAASAHATLLKRAANESADPGGNANTLLADLFRLLRRLPTGALKREFLLDPAFIEGLHCARDRSPSLAAWHRCMAEPSIASIRPTAADGRQPDRLANAWLALTLREDPSWQGQLALATDFCGRLRFPLCDWSIELSAADERPGTVLADECVIAVLTRREVRLLLAQTDEELVVMPRADWLRMLVADSDAIDGRRMTHRPSRVRLRLQFAGRIPGWRVRYDPIAIADAQQAALTGGLAAALLAAIGRQSPSVAQEFCRFISVARGWALSPAAYGTVHSFSDPTLPRVVNFNVPYTAQGQPQVSPCCFTWFGHELGHTKSYLIETILHVRGLSLSSAQGDYTQPIERYARRLPIRTLLQIPYTHLYELVLLSQGLKHRFAALPWTVADDPISVGNDIRAEIEEAYDRIAEEVELTACGRAVIARLKTLSARVFARWDAVCGRRRLRSKGRRA